MRVIEGPTIVSIGHYTFNFWGVVGSEIFAAGMCLLGAMICAVLAVRQVRKNMG